MKTDENKILTREEVIKQMQGNRYLPAQGSVTEGWYPDRPRTSGFETSPLPGQSSNRW